MATLSNCQDNNYNEERQLEMVEPMCLIDNTKDDNLHVNQEALNILSSIKQPVVVVSIVGMYRTGKSYLMNRLAGKRKGFSLGSTIQSETKGIWMWCVPHPEREGHTLVLLDTEGLGDVEKGDQTHDTWIFALAVLLSSTLVYNSMGTINNEAIMSLHYVTELTEHIKVKSSRENVEETIMEYARFFPSFVWAVRDFTLELKIDGQKVTADEYLENSLKLMKGNTTRILYSNAPRECIRNYFPVRKCFVFDQPVYKDKLKIIEQLNDSDLEPNFVKQTSKFCSYIFSHSKVKMMSGGITITGNMLGNLAVTYVDSIRSGQVPCLENAVATLAQIENSSAVEKAYALYTRLLEEKVVLHTDTREELSQVHEGCLKEALQYFMDHSFKDKEQRFQTNLMERIKNEYEKKCHENEMFSLKHCTALLQQLWHNLDHESYMRPGGYSDYRVQVDALIQKYRDTPGKGIKAEHALETYLKDKKDLGSSILMADRSLTERQKQLEEEKAHAEMERFKADVAKREQEELARRLEDTEKAHRENEQQLLEKMEKERQAIFVENQRMLEQRLQEQKKLMMEGFDAKAEAMRSEIQSLKRQMAASQNTSRGGGCILL